MVHLYGVMGENMLENGRKGNSMEKDYLLSQMENKRKENGWTGEDLSGWMNKMLVQNDFSYEIFIIIFLILMNLQLLIFSLLLSVHSLLYHLIY